MVNCCSALLCKMTQIEGFEIRLSPVNTRYIGARLPKHAFVSFNRQVQSACSLPGCHNELDHRNLDVLLFYYTVNFFCLLTGSPTAEMQLSSVQWVFAPILLFYVTFFLVFISQFDAASHHKMVKNAWSTLLVLSSSKELWTSRIQQEFMARPYLNNSAKGKGPVLLCAQSQKPRLLWCGFLFWHRNRSHSNRYWLTDSRLEHWLCSQFKTFNWGFTGAKILEC